MLRSDGPELLRQRWLLAAIIWLSILFLEYLEVMNGVRSVAETVFLPAQTGATKIVSLVARPLLYLDTAYREGQIVQSLQLQLTAAQAEIAQLQGLKTENEAFRELFKDSGRNWQDSIIASPIVAYGNPAVAVGSNAGVKTGDAVLSHQTLIGRVGVVTNHQSEIQLLSNVSTPFLLAQTESGVTGIIRGTGSQIIFTEVSKSSVVTNGELVVTSGQAGVPKNILIGTIRTQSSSTAEPVLTFPINQPVSFYESSILELVSSGQ